MNWPALLLHEDNALSPEAELLLAEVRTLEERLDSEHNAFIAARNRCEAAREKLRAKIVEANAARQRDRKSA